MNDSLFDTLLESVRQMDTHCQKHDMVWYNWATHYRGRFIHQHKGKKKRQHKLKDSYVKDVTRLADVWPVSIGDTFDTLDKDRQSFTLNFDWSNKYEQEGKSD
jgi:hypothetical protein